MRQNALYIIKYLFVKCIFIDKQLIILQPAIYNTLVMNLVTIFYQRWEVLRWFSEWHLLYWSTKCWIFQSMVPLNGEGSVSSKLSSVHDSSSENSENFENFESQASDEIESCETESVWYLFFGGCVISTYSLLFSLV